MLQSEHHESIPLSSYDGADGEEGGDFVDPHATVLAQSSVGEELNERFDDRTSTIWPRFISKIASIMSRASLLGNRSSTGTSSSYGALREDSSLSDAPVGQNGATSSLEATKSTNGSTKNRRHLRNDSASSSRRSLQNRLRNENTTFNVEPEHPGGQSGHLGEGFPTTLSEILDGEDSESDAEAIDSDEGEDRHDPPDNSRYPQVRASVAATDDFSASINTPRMWTLSMICAFVGSATNLFFSLRYPSVAITPVIALVIVHPLGRTWDKLLKAEDDPLVHYEYGNRIDPVMPADGVRNSQSRHFRLWLGQGAWNEKEHACVYISSNVAFGFAFATDIIVEQAKFYKQDVSVVYQLLLTISTQILGYSFAGITRRYLVRPPSMIWPGTLMSTAMFTTMHRSDNRTADGWKITRWRFFVFVWCAAFSWYFVPGYLMPALSYFSVITWFTPKNVIVASLFGVRSGLGMFPVTFDWSQIAYIGSPLLTPWWAAANVVGGLVAVMWVLAPILYYKNTFFSGFLPILSASVYDNTAKAYDVSKILTPDYKFDKDAYLKYSRVYLPITYALSYGVQFAGLAALVTHTACWHGRDIWSQTMRSFRAESPRDQGDYQPVNASQPSTAKARSASVSRRTSLSTQESGVDARMTGEDVHNRLMNRYDDAPIWWYLATFVIMLGIGIFLVEYFPVYLPWYGLLLALGLTTILFIPVGIVMAITNQHSSLYLVCQIICGFVFPGRPVANMVFVTYSYISSAQGVKFSSDLKLGHYMRIPPRLLFKVQMFATLLSSVTQIGVLNWMFQNLPDLCSEDAINGFSCPLARVHFNGSILWGVVGPKRFFGKGEIYQPLVWGFLIGATLPVLVWLIGRRSAAGSIWRKINLPVVFGSLSWIPPATGLNFSTWALVCYVFNSHLRRRFPAWWGKYTMTMSAALDSGLAFGVVVIFFVLVYPPWGARLSQSIQWWGTSVYKEGCDWIGCPWKTLKEGETFD